MTPADPLRALREVSARIGANPLLVQGAGGNTSLKTGDQLWVKASGTWLSDAIRREIFVSLSLPASRALLSSAAGTFDAARLAPGSGLRPSIETALHAVMPHRAVVHAHAVNSMVTAVLPDGRERAARALDGIRWAWVPYCRPGLQLAEAIERTLPSRPDVVLLQNHGVVIGDATIEGAEATLHEVEARLRFEERALQTADPVRLAEVSTPLYEPVAPLSGVALDPRLVRMFSTTCFIPDQAVFLGGAIPLLDEVPAGIAAPLVLVRGVGAFAVRTRSAGADSLLAALREIARRIPPDTQPVGLPPSEIVALLGWDAEIHRQRLDRDRG